MASIAGIIFSNLNDNTLSRLTGERTVAAIPFACRYRLIDFCISNMINAGVTNVNIAANYNYRSLIEHIGSGKDYDLARRSGGINIITPLDTSLHGASQIYRTRMEALLYMKDHIKDFTEDYVVMTDSDTVLTIDLNDVIRFHKENNAHITFITKLLRSDHISRKSKMMIKKQNDRITDISMKRCYSEDCPELSLNIFVIKTEDLKRMLEEAGAHQNYSLTSVFLTGYKRERYFAYTHRGFAATVSDINDYYKYSIELTTSESARRSLLGNKSLPIYTRVKNSAPTSHTEDARVTGSIIADDCIIEGSVINSVVFRGVHVEKGATVKNSILFHGTRIGTDSQVNCIISDKFATVGRNLNLSGSSNLPFYIEKGVRI